MGRLGWAILLLLAGRVRSRDGEEATEQVEGFPKVHPCLRGLQGEFVIATVHTAQGRLFDMAVRPHHKDPMSRVIRKLGFWEIQSPQDVANLADAKLLVPDGRSPYLLDVGPNIGFYTLLFAHAKWHSIAIEPMPSNLRALNVSLCLNPRLAQRVTIVPVAASAPLHAGRACTVRASNDQPGGIGNGVLSCNSTLPCVSGHNDICKLVYTRTVDSVLRELKPPGVDLVKIDIEGHECDVMASNGSTELFTHWQPGLIQWEGKSKAVDDCMRRRVKRYGYRIGTHYGNDRNTVGVRVPTES